MKKMISWILAILLALSLSACTDILPKPNGNSSSGTNSNTENNGNNQEKKKISGTIEVGTVFSDGLALVRLVGDENTTYCIDKEGYIVFEADIGSGSFGTGFRNGYAIISGKIYDRTGESTAPEDVGATEFYLTIAEHGYILATKITSDFTGTKKELGILNEDFNWIVSPSEELYQGLFTDHGSPYVSTYSNHYLYLPGSDSYLNILTGKISETEPEDFVSDPELRYIYGGTYRDEDANIVIDLREYDTIAFGGSFVDEKAVIVFKNQVSKYDYKYYYTIIDKDGVFAFDPVEIDLINVEADMSFDGEYVVFESQTVTAHNTCYYACYNSNGEFEGKAEISRRKSISLCEGIIKAYEKDLYGPDSTYYYNPDFTPLFE